MSSGSSVTREALAERKLTFRLYNTYRTLALCVAMGMGYEEAAAQTGVELAQVEYYVRDPRFIAMYEEFMKQMEERVIERMATRRDRAAGKFQLVSDESADRVVELMRNAQNENVAFKAAISILGQVGIDLTRAVKVVGEGRGEEIPEEQKRLHAQTVEELEE